MPKIKNISDLKKGDTFQVHPVQTGAHPWVMLNPRTRHVADLHTGVEYILKPNTKVVPGAHLDVTAKGGKLPPAIVDLPGSAVRERN